MACFLHCISNSHGPISLPHLEEVIVGRSPVTGITDPNCSRRQIYIKADCEEKKAYVKQLGVNQSGINGFSIVKDELIIVDDGARIELLLNDYIHEIKFEHLYRTKITNKASHSDVESASIQPLKRAREDEEVNGSKKKAKISICNKDFKDDDGKQDFVAVGDRKEQSRDDNTSGMQESRSTSNCKATTEDALEKIDNGLLYIFTTKGVISSAKIAAYDIDGTIIKTKSGLVFPKTIDDWQLAFPEVPTKLKKLAASGFKIVFFTNQASIANGKLKINDFQKKLENILRRIGVPCQAFISSGKGIYRKPAMGMWDTLKQMKNDDLDIDMKVSFYCGDAAGRKKDHSLADRLFAENIGLPFKTPEHHFGGSPEVPFNRPTFDPKLIDKSIKNKDLLSDEQEIIVLVGLPGSGKSHLSKRLEERSRGRYRPVCRDKLGAWQKCISEASKLVKAGKSIIADSTNPDKESRARWASLAKSNNLPCRCVIMDVPFAHAQHNNRFRQLTDTTHLFVADMVFHSYRKKYEEPNTSEGFKEIVKVTFIPEFESDQQEELYYKHLLEK